MAFNQFCIDIVSRRIKDTYFDIICDDEGLLKDNPRITAVDTEGNPMLVGNLIFSHTDENGETIGVTDEEIDASIASTLALFAGENTGVPVKEGDEVLFDYVGKLDGEVFEGEQIGYSKETFF